MAWRRGTFDDGWALAASRTATVGSSGSPRAPWLRPEGRTRPGQLPEARPPRRATPRTSPTSTTIHGVRVRPRARRSRASSRIGDDPCSARLRRFREVVASHGSRELLDRGNGRQVEAMSPPEHRRGSDSMGAGHAPPGRFPAGLLDLGITRGKHALRDAATLKPSRTHGVAPRSPGARPGPNRLSARSEKRCSPTSSSPTPT